jgi:hypothetical protein
MYKTENGKIEQYEILQKQGVNSGIFVLHLILSFVFYCFLVTFHI